MGIWRWRASCIMYPRLKTYNSIVNDIKMNVWWSFCKYNPEWTTNVSCVMAVLRGTQPKQMQIFQDSTYMICQLCKACVHESAQHVLFYCSELEAVRRDAWDRVRSTAQSYGGPPVQPQWYYKTNAFWDRRKLYKRYAQYVYSIYKTRAESYSPKNWDP